MKGGRAVSLRALLFWGGNAIVLTTIVGAIVALILTSHLRRQAESGTQTIFEEEKIADRIATAVSRQVLGATRYLNQPNSATLAAFREDGDQAASALTLYMFRPLSVRERLQVESIKERHQALEVIAESAFDLASTGNRAEAQRRSELLFRRASDLQTELDRFVAMRLEDHRRLQLHQAAMLRELYLIVIFISALLACGAFVLLRSFRRRLIPRLEALSDASRAIATGDLEARVSIGGTDELATLGEAFNRMAEALQQARHDLRARNEELAATVERLRVTQREVVQNEKLSALGAMLAGLAHELNNPLASVLGNAELLSARLHELPGAEVGALAEELADPIAHEALRARELIRNLLQMSRQSDMALRSVNLNAALEVAVALRAYAFAQAGLRLEVDVQPDLWVRADRQRLQQTFLNVINNAFDAMVEGGGTMLRIAGFADGPHVIVVLQDDGPGMRAPERIFDPFYTTKPVGSGTGLGLTIVHRFLEEAGGSIEAMNAPEGGAIFRIRMRAARPATGTEDAMSLTEPSIATLIPTSRGAAPAEAPADRPRPRVLVVEDEEPIRKLHRRILSRLNAEILVAASGIEARDILLNRDVDLVVSDVKMPGLMNGTDLFRWVCEQRSALAERFLFVTGDTHDPVLLELFRQRPDRFITKPFQVQEYIERVGSLLHGDPGARGGEP